MIDNKNIGNILENGAVELTFNTFNSAGASVTVTNLAVGDIKIHKDGGVTQRTSTNGVTLSIDFDGITGNHLIAIDTSDNTDAGFYVAGSNYDIRLEGITVDSQTINAFIGSFSIENRVSEDPSIKAKTKDANLKDALRNITDVIESNRPHHTHAALGEIFYVDPVNGDTFANGNRGGISDPLLTIQDCHDNLVTDSNHDLIILVPGASGGPTTHTVASTTTLSKRYVFIRGPGRDFIITRSGNGDTIAITGEGVEISGIQLGTAATGSGDGVNVTADFAYLHNIWINDTRGNGFLINQAENCVIQNNRFQNTGTGGSGDGLQISGTGSSSSNNVVRNNIFEDVQGDAIKVVGGTILDTIIQDNIIHGSTGWGINISADSTDAIVTGNRLGNNTSGDIQDLGTTTVKLNNEQWGTDELTADAVWDEELTGSLHNISTSAGRRLRQLSTPVLTEGPSAGSNAATYINLEVASASALDGAYDPGVVFITTGTGMGQSRQIFEYDGTLKRAFINRDWKSIPALNDQYVIVANSGDTHVNEGLAGGGGPSTITLNALASDVDDTYIDQVVFIVAGTGQDQAGNITAYNGTTKVATVEHAWATEPVSGSIYAILPNITHSLTEIQSGISKSSVTERIAAIQEADKVFVPAAGTLTYNTKGTSSGLLKKNLKDPSGATVDSTEDIIASEVDTTP